MKFYKNEVIVFIRDDQDEISVEEPATNDLFAHPPDEPIPDHHRVLYANVSDDICVTIGIYGSVWPVVRSYSELQELANNGSVDKLGYEPFKHLYSEPEEEEKKRIEKRWLLIKPLVSRKNFSKLFYRMSRGRLISEYAKGPEITDRDKACRSTLEHLIRIYMQRGMRKGALRTDLHNCGAPGKARITRENEHQFTKQLGRPSDKFLTKGKRGINIGPDLRRKIEIIVRRELYGKKTKKYAKAFRKFQRTYYAGDFADIESCPTPNQFNDWARKILKKLGDPLRPVRIIRNIASHNADYPGQKFQIDAWLVETNIVDPDDRSKILGRPVLFVVIDVFTYAIVGIHITIEDASWNAARTALYNAMTDEKTAYFKDRFGVELEPGDWDLFCTPQEIYADRGETFTKKANSMIEGLDIELINGPAFQPSYRGVVEGRFNMVSIRIGQDLPESVNKPGRKTDRESRKDKRLQAFTTINELALFFRNAFVDFNHYHEVIHGNEREKLMLEDQIYPTPLDLWEWGGENIGGGLTIDDPDVVKASLLDKRTISVGRYGFMLYGYRNGAGLRYKWDNENEIDLITRLYGKHLNAACSDLVDEVYLIVDQGTEAQQIITLTLHDQSQAFSGLTFLEYKWVRKLLNSRSAELEQIREQAEIKNTQEWQAVLDLAKKCAAEDRAGKSNREILSNIRQNRADAQAASRLQNSEGWKDSTDSGGSSKSANPTTLKKPKQDPFDYIPPGDMSDFE